jgi:hypothetical protein
MKHEELLSVVESCRLQTLRRLRWVKANDNEACSAHGDLSRSRLNAMGLSDETG